MTMSSTGKGWEGGREARRGAQQRTEGARFVFVLVLFYEASTRRILRVRVEFYEYQVRVLSTLAY